MNMIDKVLAYIEEHHMFNEHDKVIAGISGGADSVCLLFVLLELRKRKNIDIVAVHVNHMIREGAADEDQKYTEELCKAHNVKCIVWKEDVPSLAKKMKQSEEEAGRDVRRKAFAHVLAKEKADKIAMAHHENDNAETFIMHLIRGAGINGLSGIWPVNGNIVRPLLCVSRREIEEYLLEKGITWCNDLTNDEDDYTRNRIRHKVIPLLEEESGGSAVNHINSAIKQIRLAVNFIDTETMKAYNRCVEENEDGAIIINKNELYKCHDTIKSYVVKEAVYKAAGRKKDIGTVHFEDVMKLFENTSGKKCNLPYNLVAKRNYDGVVIMKNTPKKEEGGIKITELKVPGKIFLKDKNLNIETRIIEVDSKVSKFDIPQKTYTKWFDYDIIKCRLVTRSRMAGDVITINNNGGSKKLKSYFIDEKIPADIRGEIPLIADGSDIMWVVGYRMSSRYQVTDKTRNILEIKVLEEN